MNGLYGKDSILRSLRKARSLLKTVLSRPPTWSCKLAYATLFPTGIVLQRQQFKPPRLLRIGRQSKICKSTSVASDLALDQLGLIVHRSSPNTSERGTILETAHWIAWRLQKIKPKQSWNVLEAALQNIVEPVFPETTPFASVAEVRDASLVPLAHRAAEDWLQFWGDAIDRTKGSILVVDLRTLLENHTPC
ncbi:hypothetical protein CC86DRAFT_111311 [Ophiobolus disseminans]|uniref:Uncharacterized protein n=1 Tax=Ophiobolus disseminans TaxID=1469910 RepID=A0A6A6ZLN4_9PLEO|nr:hypothetical protein CC86DRAFT_111311 [Ophiobolus disseminans]